MPQSFDDEFDDMLAAVYDNYVLENMEEIRSDFVEFLINIATEATDKKTISSDCFALIEDLRTIFAEIISNGLLHGIHPTYHLKKTDTKIIIKVVNQRIEKEDGVHQNCGRGMTFIKELIMAHRDIKIIHSHIEDADTYKAYLVISLEDFINHIKQHCTPQA
jgi:hypothetical protein